VRWAESRLAQEQDRRENITLAEHAQRFWNPTAPFAVDRAAHGWAVSRTYLDIAEGYTPNHLLPVWGGRRLGDLDARTLDDWIVELHRERKLVPGSRLGPSACRPFRPPGGPPPTISLLSAIWGLRDWNVGNGRLGAYCNPVCLSEGITRAHRKFDIGAAVLPIDGNRRSA
jgi:hypothetical protein